MSNSVSVPRPAALAGQAMIAMTGGAVLALAPPAEGAMLLVPLPGTATGHAVDVAVAHGAALLAAGPVAGTVIVRVPRGARDGITLRDGILVLAAGATGCSGGRPS